MSSQTTTSPEERVAHHEALKANEAALITLTRPPDWHSWEFGPAMAWLADRLGSAASDRILAQLERSWDCPEAELWATFLWDRQAQQLTAKRAYDLDYLGILTDWHTRHGERGPGLPESLRVALRCRGERDVMTPARAAAVASR
jgi:hypothetical protein